MKISIAMSTLIFFSTALAILPELVALQTCDSASCPNLEWLLAPIVGAGATLWDGLQNVFQTESAYKLPPVPLYDNNDNWKSESLVSTSDSEEILVTGENKGCDAVAPFATDIPVVGASSFAPQTFKHAFKPLIVRGRSSQTLIHARLHR